MGRRGGFASLLNAAARGAAQARRKNDILLNRRTRTSTRIRIPS